LYLVPYFLYSIPRSWTPPCSFKLKIETY
jgi:hypothetical protein